MNPWLALPLDDYEGHMSSDPVNQLGPLADLFGEALARLRPRSVAFKSLVADEIARSVWPFVAEGRLKPVIDSTFPLAQAADAHRRMEAGDHIGKLVLEIA